MPRVILTLLLFCQAFYLHAAEVGFAEPGLLGGPGQDQPRVVIVHDPRATHLLSAQSERVVTMVARGVTAFTGKPDPAAAWRSLVKPEDVVGIKVHSAPGAASGTRPAVAAAVVRGLLEAGHAPRRIVIWDRRLEDLRTAGFADVAAQFGVRVAGAMDAGFDPSLAYENSVLGQPVFGDFDFGRTVTNGIAGRKSYFSRLLTRDLTRHIIIAPLLNHNQAGVSGILYTMASASVDNFLRFEINPGLLTSAVPEIFGETLIADRVALNIVDALIGQYEGSQRTRLHYSATLNEIRLGTDPVALDVLSLDELNRIRMAAGVGAVTNRAGLYDNARLVELGTDDLHRLDIQRVEIE